MIALPEAAGDLAALRVGTTRMEPRQVAREFESVMISEVLKFGAKPMFGENPLDGGSAGQMAREQFFSQLAAFAARGAGLGLAEQLEAEMTGASTSASADASERDA